MISIYLLGKVEQLICSPGSWIERCSTNDCLSKKVLLSPLIILVTLAVLLEHTLHTAVRDGGCLQAEILNDEEEESNSSISPPPWSLIGRLGPSWP